jgi:hypothetical protein
VQKKASDNAVLPNVWSSTFAVWFWNGKQFLGARVNKLIVAGEIAAVYERMGKPFLGSSGYQYGIRGLNSKLISWARVKEKSAKRKHVLKKKVQREAENEFTARNR